MVPYGRSSTLPTRIRSRVPTVHKTVRLPVYRAQRSVHARLLGTTIVEIHINEFLTLAEHWNGTSWSVQPSASPIGASVSRLSAVSCPTAQMCIAVGQSSRFNGETASQGRPVALAESSVAGNR